MSHDLPGRGILGWLGRQVGYVRKAVKQDVGQRVVYRDTHFEQVPHPDHPNVTLRRTTIDEAVVEKTGQLKK